MPELPEVETVRLGLNQVTLGQEIVGGQVLLDRSIAHPIPVGNFLDGLKGTAIAHWHRRGKYLLAELCEPGTGDRRESQQEEGKTQFPTSPNSGLPSPFSKGWLGVHLRMTGQLLWLHQDTPLQKHARVRLFFADRRELRFADQRTFGKMWWVPPTVAPESIITGLQLLGPEPFSAEFSVEYLANQLRVGASPGPWHRRRPIKTALLDQSLVAGVGNIYADEALFKAGVLPTTLCSQLKTEQISRLHAAVIKVLQDAIEAGGSTIRNFLNVQGVNGNYAGSAWVYNRAGDPCRVCSTPIERLKLAGRSTHFCANCQR